MGRLARLAVVAGVLGALVPAAGAGASTRGVRVFRLPSGESLAPPQCFQIGPATECPHALALDAHGALWFPSGYGELGRMDLGGHFSQVPLGVNGYVQSMTLATDGSLWFDESQCPPGYVCNTTALGRMASGGGVTWYPLRNPADPTSSLEPAGDPVADLQDAVWVYSSWSADDPNAPSACGVDGYTYLFRVDGSGDETPYPFCGSPWPALSIASDGSPWFTSGYEVAAILNRLRDDGSSVAYPLPGGVEPDVMKLGSGGAMWFAGNPLSGTAKGDDLVRFEPDGTSTIYHLPGVDPSGLAEGPDGEMWMTDLNENGEDHGEVWRLDPSGGAMRYSLHQFAGLSSILTGPDGAMWMAAHAAGGDAIVRLDLSAVPDACASAETFDATSTGKLIPRPVIRPPVRVDPSMKLAARFASQVATASDEWQWAVKLGLLVVPGTEEVGALELVDGTDIIGAGVEDLLDKIAADPPDRHFRHVSTPHIPAVRRLTARGLLTPSITAAVNRLDAAQAQLIGYGNAMLDAVQRSQGAADAGSAAWTRRQDRAATAYAKRFAAALRAVARARSGLSRALAKGRLGHIHFSASVLRRTRQRLARHGAPGAVLRGLHRLGFSRSDTSRWAKSLTASPAPAGTLSGAVGGHGVTRALDVAAGLSSQLAATSSCAAGS